MAVLNNFKETLGNIFKKPATIDYPIKPRPVPERSRGHVAIDVPACIFCGLCQKKCPTHAITVVKPEVTWSINRMRCIQCGACVEVCPKKCLELANAQTLPSSKPVIDTFKGAPPEQKPKEITNA